MKAMYDYQLLAQTITLLFAIFFTIILIGKYMEFFVRGMKGLNATISLFLYWCVAISWAVFFWLIKAQF